MTAQILTNETGQPTYLEILAYLGMTRHLGAWNSTKELATLCHIENGKHILEVGCGTGKTASWYAKRRGCRVIGVDLSPRMIEWAKETAQREGVLNQVEFKTADARQLPFDDATFDAVLCESVLGFVPDKANALREFIRVCKPGGYVGMNESTWLAAPVPHEIVETLATAGFSGAQLITLDEWSEILKYIGIERHRHENVPHFGARRCDGSREMVWRHRHTAEHRPYAHVCRIESCEQRGTQALYDPVAPHPEKFLGFLRVRNLRWQK